MKISHGVGDGWKNIVNYCLKLKYKFAIFSHPYLMFIGYLYIYFLNYTSGSVICYLMCVCACTCVPEIVNNRMLENDWSLTALIYGLIGCFRSKLSNLTCPIKNINFVIRQAKSEN